jgi:hypothetical protein
LLVLRETVIHDREVAPDLAHSRAKRAREVGDLDVVHRRAGGVDVELDGASAGMGADVDRVRGLVRLCAADADQ